MHIRRDRSHLRFGRYAQRRGGGTLLIIWGVVMAALIGVIVRFDAVQDWALTELSGESTPTPHAITHARQGERAYLAGDLAQAVTAYGQAYALEPGNLDIAFEYGRVLIYHSYAGRRYAQYANTALEVAQALVALYPDDARAQALLCWALVEADDAQGAIGAGLRAVELAPDSGPAWAYLSLAYLSAGGRTDYMLDAADKAVAAAPDNVDARRTLALALTSFGQLQAAIQQYESAIQLHPRLDALYFELAAAYIAQQNYDSAIAAYDRILALEPDNVKAYTRLCATYFGVGEWTRAEEACAQATDLDPQYPEAFQQLGKTQYKRRNYEGAVETLAACAELQEAQSVPLAEREVECYYIRALALMMLERCEEAWPLFMDARLMPQADDVTGSINEGMQSCVEYEPQFSASDIPTPVPTQSVLEVIIDVY